MTANLGLRWDKNHGRDQAGNLVAKDSAFSPRLGVVIDPFGESEVVDHRRASRSTSRRSTRRRRLHVQRRQSPRRSASRTAGRDFNADPAAAALTPTPEAIRAIFDWYTANGGPTLPYRSQPAIPGVSPQILGDLVSPNILEYAVGINRQVGARGAVRADYVFRDYRDFYSQRTDTTTGSVTNPIGQTFDLAVIENTNVAKRLYQGLTTQGTYRFAGRTDVGATYTLSRAWGNFNGENVASGPIPAEMENYPEFIQERWNYPEGDLQVDQRHRARLWVNSACRG